MAKLSREERKKKVIEVLNKARAMELQAIHQYMNQHYNLDDMDYGELAAKVKLIAIDEMRHAEMFAERIKELGGEPTTELAGKVAKGQDDHLMDCMRYLVMSGLQIATIMPYEFEEDFYGSQYESTGSTGSGYFGGLY